MAETLTIYVGAAVAKNALKAWLADDSIWNATSDTLINKLSSYGLDFFERRKLERQIDAISDEVSSALATAYRERIREVDENEQESIFTSVAEILNQKLPGVRSFVTSMSASEQKLYQELKARSENLKVGLSHRGQTIFDNLLYDACAYVADIYTGLPEFSPNILRQLLDSQENLHWTVTEILREVQNIKHTVYGENTQESAARSEELYRKRLQNKYDYVELFGIDLPPTLRRQRLSIAYVTLSMQSNLSTSNIAQKVKSLLPTRFSGYDVRTIFEYLESIVQFGSKSIGTTPDVDKGLASIFSDIDLNVAKKAWNEYFAGYGFSSADDILASSQRILIRGEAGTGKTTLVYWLAVSAAAQRLKAPLSDRNIYVPLVVRLRSFVNDPLPTPYEIVRHCVPTVSDAIAKDWPSKVIESGRAMLLVDGLDEIPQNKREDVKSWLNELCEIDKNNIVIVTSRPRAVDDSWLQDLGFAEAELLPMSWSDVEILIDQWHEAILDNPSVTEDSHEVAIIARDLKKAIRSTKALRTLAKSPLLCAMICALNFNRREQLPSNRIELYNAAVEMLLERRDSARAVKPIEQPELSLQQKRAVLQNVAYWMLKNGLSTVEYGRVKNRISNALKNIHNLPASATGASVLDLLIDRSGVIRSPSVGKVDFIHKSFQEYLAACAVINQDEVEFLVQQAHLDQWYEVVVLVAGLLPSYQTDNFLSSLIHRGDEELDCRHRLYVLAVASMETVVERSPETNRVINDRLRTILPPKNMTEAKALSAAGEIAAPLLVRKREYGAREAAACVRALTLIGGEDALRNLETYGNERRKTVIDELLTSWPYFEPGEYAKRVLSKTKFRDQNLTLSHVKSLDGLEHLQQLKGLEVRNASRVEGLEVLSSLPSLAKVRVHNCNSIEKLPSFNNNDALYFLNLFDLERLTSLKGIETAKNLNRLALTGLEKVREIYPLGDLEAPERLALGDTPNDADLSPLGKLQSLTRSILEQALNFRPVVVFSTDRRIGT